MYNVFVVSRYFCFVELVGKNNTLLNHSLFHRVGFYDIKTLMNQIELRNLKMLSIFTIGSKIKDFFLPYLLIWKWLDLTRNKKCWQQNWKKMWFTREAWPVHYRAFGPAALCWKIKCWRVPPSPIKLFRLESSNEPCDSGRWGSNIRSRSCWNDLSLCKGFCC